MFDYVGRTSVREKTVSSTILHSISVAGECENIGMTTLTYIYYEGILSTKLKKSSRPVRKPYKAHDATPVFLIRFRKFKYVSH